MGHGIQLSCSSQRMTACCRRPSQQAQKRPVHDVFMTCRGRLEPATQYNGEKSAPSAHIAVDADKAYGRCPDECAQLVAMQGKCKIYTLANVLYYGKWHVECHDDTSLSQSYPSHPFDGRTIRRTRHSANE